MKCSAFNNSLKKAKFKINAGFIFLFLIFFTRISSAAEVYIRVNQVGFLPGDIKTAVIMSAGELPQGEEFLIYKRQVKTPVFRGELNTCQKGEGNYPDNYSIDFSGLKDSGEFIIVCHNVISHPFSIGNGLYNSIADSLLMFFKVQRCGFTEPLLHGVCHMADATSLIYGKSAPRQEQLDVSGGWHDAGDYVKFFNTTAFSTYMMLFSYEFDPVKFGFDSNNNGIPDILEEAKIGLDWLLKSHIGDGKFIIQVQDLRDHDQGWRLPENDKLSFDRPAFVGGGKNTAGIYSAIMALAYRIWKVNLNYDEFAQKCLNEAEAVYAGAAKMPGVDKSGSGMYLDENFAGKMALGAIELYESTNDGRYLKEAISYADEAKSDYWWSWGNMNSLADYKIAKFEPRIKDYLFNNLKNFDDIKNKNVFGEAARDNWGSNTAVMGAALQAVLWKSLTGSSSFDSLVTFQRDYILGKNRWGISFIYNIGSVFSQNFHSQVGYLRGGYLPGAVAAGPISRKKLESLKIEISDDALSDFQTDSDVYQDVRQDYVTNEPTITTNATAIFLMGYFAGRE